MSLALSDHDDEELVRAINLLRKNVLEREGRSENQIAHVCHLGEGEVVQCCKKPVEWGESACLVKYGLVHTLKSSPPAPNFPGPVLDAACQQHNINLCRSSSVIAVEISCKAKRGKFVVVRNLMPVRSSVLSQLNFVSLYVTALRKSLSLEMIVV